MNIVCIFAVFFFCLQTTTADLDSAGAIQIAAPINHTFHLQADELRPILENENIKDRNVVVVSIAGAYREGKSFLMNFFLKYLYAQYKTHDISDWIGESSNGSQLNGFKWRAGRKRETVGIWMWSEVFTHDYENGEKVAIILLDTQGIFDDQSSVRDCTTIFALSMMLSSVQCYNLKENIKEDDLQHLELFTEYGRLALEQTNEKPFQKLLFIVRDWPFAYETNYGWEGKKIIDQSLAGNDDQTPEMHQLRQRIQSSFEEISAFLMPHPGMIVARGNEFTGELHQIETEFIKYAKDLVPGLFSPENLIVKRINGQKVRARDLLQYLEAYINIFNGDSIPEPRSVLMATAEAGHLILHRDLVNYYFNSVQKQLNEVEYFKEADLENIHQKTKNEAVEQFREKPKLGSNELAATFQQKIETDIDEKFIAFKQTNEEKRKNFIERADLHNAQLSSEIKAAFEQLILTGVENSTSVISYSSLSGFITENIQRSMQDFDARKMGDEDIPKSFHDELEQELNDFHSALIRVCESYDKDLNLYAESMQDLLNAKSSFFEQNELIKLHADTKNGVLAQFSEESKIGGTQMTIIFQRNIDHQIQQKFVEVEKKNEEKRQQFIAAANAHNENLLRDIKATFENKMLGHIGGTYLKDDAFFGLFLSSKTAALDDFEARKMGDGQISNSFRERLERDLDNSQVMLKAKNESNKPPEPVREIHHYHDSGSSCTIM